MQLTLFSDPGCPWAWSAGPALATALEWLPGVDAKRLVAASLEPETEELFAADRRETRSAAGQPIEFQGRSATTPEGEVRYKAPSAIFTADDGRSLEAGGFQPT